MKYLKFFDLEETYMNEKSSLEYFNVSYTKDTDKIWIKEEPYLLMKFKVEEALIIDDNDDKHKVLTRKICNDLSVFKSIQIGNDEPINIEVEEKENIIDSNSFILNENDYFTSTYIPENNINGDQQCTLVINEQFTKDDCIVIFDSSNDYPYVSFSISEAIEYGFINEINENTFDTVIMPNGFIFFVIKKEGAELLSERSIITSDMLQYIISSSLKYKEIKNNEIYLPSVEGEYMVKGVLNQSINSLSSLFSNNVNYEYTENTNNYDDIEINNDYEVNIINLISINIPKQISNLLGAFNNCRKLKDVKIDNQSILTSIGNYAFEGCSSLSEINIPDSVISIGECAFTNCSSLSSITFEEGSQLQLIGELAFTGCTSLSSITIPNSVTSISRWAFEGCSSLSSVTIPNSVTSIGNHVFTNCYSLSSIDIPNSITTIEGGVFNNCTSLTSVTIPNSVTSIGNSAFKSCSSLSSITIPNSVKTIGDWVFGFCSSLSSIEIPSGVTSIGDSAFAYCYSLSSITIPDSVISIGNEAFTNCSSLSSIEIPSGVTSIGNYAFHECYSLSEITCLATTAPTISSNTFESIKSNGVLYYPQGSNYSSWLSTSNYYLGYYNWTFQEI